MGVAHPLQRCGWNMTKWVYAFGDGKAEGEAGMRDLLGGKGANLAEMSNLGLPVPPGFTITTEVCTYYYDHGRSLPAGAEGAGRGGARPRSAGWRADLRRRGEPAARLGALGRPRLDAGHDGHGPQSRPQRRDRRGLAGAAGDERFAYDSYRRFITMYCERRARRRARRFRGGLDEPQGRARAIRSTPSSPPTTGRR